MRAPIAKIVRNAIGFLPGKRMLSEVGALLPPGIKGSVVKRIFGVLSNNLASDTPIATNLGISSSFRVQLSAAQGETVLFGTPRDYVTERGALYLAAALAPDSKAFIDIGTNHGYFVFFLRGSLPKALPIFYFEPNPDLYRELVRNFDANGFSGIEGFAVAMGETPGTATFHLDRTDDSASTFSAHAVEDHSIEKIEVPVTTLHEFLSGRKLDELLVKVDIENLECQFMEGAKDSFPKVKYLIMEVLMEAVQKKFIMQMRERFGWEAYYINDFLLQHSADGTFEYNHPQYNWLFCRLKPDELGKKARGHALPSWNDQGPLLDRFRKGW